MTQFNIVGIDRCRFSIPTIAIDGSVFRMHINEGKAIEVLDVVEKHGNAIELNTSGFFKQCNEQYPSFDILQEAYLRNIPIVVSADAHDAKHVNRNFLIAKDLLQKAKYKV